jgi:cytochrome c oxidase subunit 2
VNRRAPCLLPLVAALALAGCGPQDFMHGGGPAARGIAHLGWFALGVFIAVTILVWLLMAAIVLRRRGGSFAEHAPVAPSSVGIDWVLIGGFAIPAAILALLFTLSVNSMERFPMEHSGTGAPLIRVTGRQWWFDAQYLFARDDQGVHVPGEIHIPTGCAVDLELVSKDVIHSFWVPKLHGKVDMVPGQVNRIRIEADSPGIFEGECGEFCGPQHAHMRLRVVAEDGKDFMRWLDAQRADAAAPATDEALAGRHVFENAACALCHAVRGTQARADVGPDLTHVASRARIAGYSIDNDTAHLAAWIVHAQSLKPGAQMPDLDQLSGTQLRQLTAYLRSLE